MKNYNKEQEIYDNINQKYDRSRGFIDRDLDVLLDNLEKVSENGNYVEIGVCEGSSITAAAMFRPDVNCYGIEIHSIDKALEIIKEEKLNNIELIQGDSAEVCKTWNKDIDMLFIDGGHDTPEVFLDVIGWFPHVKNGCKILLHDYEPDEPGTRFDVGQLGKVFIGHNKFKTYHPAIEDGISSSMFIVTKL